MNSILFLPRLNATSRLFYLHFLALHYTGLFMRLKPDNWSRKNPLKQTKGKKKPKHKNVDFKVLLDILATLHHPLYNTKQKYFTKGKKVNLTRNYRLYIYSFFWLWKEVWTLPKAFLPIWSSAIKQKNPQPPPPHLLSNPANNIQG